MWYYQNEEAVQKLDLRHKVRDKTRGLCLFGTVPPPTKVDMQTVSNCAKEVAESLKDLQPDGVIVYDIQDEKSRSGEERPFPFLATHEPRLYAQLLVRHSSDWSRDQELEPIVYRAHQPYEAIRDEEHITKIQHWLEDTWDNYNVRNLVLVGGSSVPPPNCQKPVMTIQEISQVITDEVDRDFLLGGITIPERHRDRGNEHLRLVNKVDSGIEFFTSQVIYNADSAICLVRDYDDFCKAHNIQPVRIVFTFAPFGSESTVKFLRWLGVELPEGTVKRVLSRPNLRMRIEESLEICWENFTRILAASRRLGLDVPIGVSVESVSKSRMESEGALKLFAMLKTEMEAFYADNNNYSCHLRRNYVEEKNKTATGTCAPLTTAGAVESVEPIINK